jgi:hypothetical protein
VRRREAPYISHFPVILHVVGVLPTEPVTSKLRYQQIRSPRVADLLGNASP